MDEKLTPKQQNFVYKYIETGIASEAYRQSYSVENMSQESIWVEACRLLDNPKVSLKIKELQRKSQETHEVTVASITKELEEARTLGMTEKQTAAVVSAITAKAKLHGLMVDKTQLSTDPENPLVVILPSKND